MSARWERAQGRRTGALPVLALVLALVALTACGIDEGAVDDLEDLPGVVQASSSCELGRCTVRVDVERSVGADDLRSIMAAARDIDPAEIQIGSDDEPATEDGSFHLEIDEDSDPDEDAATAAFALDAAAVRGLGSVTVGRGATDNRVSLAVESSAAELWRLAEEVSGLLDDDLSVASLSALTPGREEIGPSRLIGRGEFPERAVAFLRAYQEAGGTFTSSIVDDTSVLLGARSMRALDDAEKLIDSVDEAAGLTISVVVSDNVQTYRADSGADEQQRQALLGALETSGLTTAVDANTITVTAASGREAKTAIEHARRSEPRAAEVVNISVRLGDSPVELHTHGSPGLLDLADGFGRDPHVMELTISSRDPSATHLKPPHDADAFVDVRLASDDLTTAVQAAARTVHRWDGTVQSLLISVTGEDPEGRQPSVTLRLDRTGDTWTPTDAGRNTDELVRQGIDAWKAGSR